jgi:hypothetical protein
MAHDEITDNSGTPISVDDRVTYAAGSADELGIVSAISDADSDTDDCGRPYSIDPAIHVLWDNGDVSVHYTYRLAWPNNDDFTTDELEVVRES